MRTVGTLKWSRLSTVFLSTRTMTQTRSTCSASDRSYEHAMKIINSRRRQVRPEHAATKPEHSQLPSKDANPDLRGTPSIVGMSEWLQALGHSAEDVNRLNVIHVAGTKGKGSTCAFTETFLRIHGERTGFPRKTGLYTSPHLLLPEERIRLDSRPISQDVLAEYFFEIYDRLPQLQSDYDSSKSPIERGPRYLQLFALLAFHVFIREKVDVAILETHNGGHYDATNVVEKPVVTTITSLGMDHVDMLGPTIENIAWHKSGIYKPGAMALSAVQDLAPAAVLKDRAQAVSQKARFINLDPRLPSEALQLKPEVQRLNASVALATAEAFLARRSPTSRNGLSDDDIAAAVKVYSWPGRFQIIHDNDRTWYLDSAHNDMSVKLAAKWYAELLASSSKNRLRILIFSHINELRDSAALLESLGRASIDCGINFDHIIFSTYDSNETSISSDSQLFTTTWRNLDRSAQIWNEPTIQGAVSKAKSFGEADVLITGSQHLVGPALRILRHEL